MTRAAGSSRNGIDVQLVPEHVPAVGLAVEAARGDAGVVVGRVPRADLQDVRDVEAQQQLHARVSRAVDRSQTSHSSSHADAWSASASANDG